MAARKITDSTEILGADVDQANDLLPLVDVSDPTDAASGTTKKIKASQAKTAIGLGNVDNTSDANKPVSTAQASAIAVVQSDVDTHEARTDNPHAVTKTQIGLSNVDNLQQIPLTEKAAANGVATLDSGTKIPIAQLPDSVVGQVEYQGTWDAASNTPGIPAASSANKGHYYVSSSSVAAGHGYPNVPNIAFDTGDWIISNGAAWEKVDNTDAVVSVFGRIGAVAATSGDYNADQITETASRKFVTSDQKDALAGTNGAPSTSNRYVTDSDPRNTNSRAPTAHTHNASDIDAGTLDGDRLPAMSTTKRGGVPATGAPSGKYLKDDGTFDTPAGGSGLTHPQVMARAFFL